VKYQRFLAATVRVAALVAAACLGACATTNVASNRTGWSDYATITTKDYEPVGIVRVTSEETRERSVFGVVTSQKGSQITYDMLIAQAAAMGADDVINVRIDRVDKTVHSTIPFFEWLIGYSERYSYTATALAIRYTDAGTGAASAAGPAPQGAGQTQASGMGGGPG
jgi:hypothetical protein